MTFDDFREIVAIRQDELRAKSLPANITQAQWKMLKHLWNAGSSFPKDWVPREELHNLVNQSDYRRRITELKDERGIDIELDRRSNSYRLKSPSLNPAFPRAYLTQSQKNQLLSSENYECQACGLTDINNENKTLQADHKIPLAREGSHTRDNWQTLCYICNVGKRRACEGCVRACEECVWAFPEKSGIRFIVPLKNELLSKLKNDGLKDHDDIVDWLIGVAEKQYDK